MRRTLTRIAPRFGLSSSFHNTFTISRSFVAHVVEKFGLEVISKDGCTAKGKNDKNCPDRRQATLVLVTVR
jgi:hypothetical protein